VPAASPAVCREALIRVRRPSFDVPGDRIRIPRWGVYGKDGDAEVSALCELEDRNPGFFNEEYRTASAVGEIRAELS
jgi:hypothetical protein